MKQSKQGMKDCRISQARKGCGSNCFNTCTHDLFQCMAGFVTNPVAIPTALGAGNRNNNGNFNNLRNNANFWSSSEYSSTNGINRNLNYDNANVNRNNNNKTNGFSVRCLRTNQQGLEGDMLWHSPSPC